MWLEHSLTILPNTLRKKVAIPLPAGAEWRLRGLPCARAAEMGGKSGLDGRAPSRPRPGAKGPSTYCCLLKGGGGGGCTNLWHRGSMRLLVGMCWGTTMSTRIV